MPSASFRFGVAKEHEVRLDHSYFGTERYFVDGKLVLQRWSFHFKGKREFRADGYQIRIELLANLKRVEANAYVDDVLIATDLFAEFNEKVAHHFRHTTLTNTLISIVVGTLVAVIIVTVKSYFVS